MVLLVPRQLLRSGMTGDVPYYGGRLSPAQAYAASHAQAPTKQHESSGTAESAPGELTNKLATLQQLLDDGLLTEDEYRTLRARVLR